MSERPGPDPDGDPAAWWAPLISEPVEAEPAGAEPADEEPEAQEPPDAG
jgi:hypothetical protein